MTAGLFFFPLFAKLGGREGDDEVRGAFGGVGVRSSCSLKWSYLGYSVRLSRFISCFVR